MGTNYIAPIWRMPRNFNKDNLSNYSINFNGSTDYIEISDNILSGLENFSISVWYNARTLPISSSAPFYDKAILGSWSSVTPQMLLYWDDPDGWRFLMTDGSSVDIIWGTATTTNEWHHIVVTYDGATLKFYHDNGNPITKPVVKGPIQARTSAWRIGVDTSSTRYWDGELSQFCLFDYALSTDQVDDLYNLENPMIIDGGEPIQYLPLGDNSNPNAPGSFPNISVGADSVFDFIPNDYIASASTSFLNNATQMSFSVWFNLDTAVINKGIVDDQNKHFAIYTKTVSGNNYSLRINLNGSANRFQLTGTPFTAGKWHNLAMTFNAGTLNFYIDGNPAAYSVYSGSIPSSLANNTGTLDIGRYSTLYWDGLISNVQIWDTELIGPEIDELYNNGQPLMTGTQPQEANLKAWYKLNQSANYEQGIGPWDIEIVGTPDYAGTADGCYTTGTALRYADTGDEVTGSGNYFRWLTPLISCKGTIDITHTLGGEYVTASSGVQLTFQYSLDGGGWVTYHNELVSSSASTTPVTFTITSATGLSCNNNIRVRVLGAGGLFNSSYIEFYNIKIADGAKTFYEQNFNSYSSLIGYNNGNVFNQSQVGNYIDPVWQIPDSRSAYPQSFEFTKTPQEYIDLGKDDWFNEYNNEITFSVWINKKDWSNTGFEGIISKYGASGSTIQYRIAYPSSASKLQFYLQGSATSGSGYLGRIDTVTLTSAQTTSDWLHILWRHSASTNTSQVIFNGDHANAVSLTNIAANPYAQPQTTVLNMIGNVSNGLQPFDGAISNYQRFNSYLDNAAVEALYNDGVPSTTAIAPANLKAWYKLDNTELFDGTNWSVENQKYPANWESSFNSSIAAGMLRDNDSKSEYDNQLFSMSVWVKPKSAVATNGVVFACQGSSNQGVALKYVNNSLVFQLGDSTTTAVDGGAPANNGNWSFYDNRVPGASPTYTPYDQWSHIVVVWNGTNSKFYINGTLVSTITPPSALTIDYSFVNTISAIGGRNDFGSGYFTGNISNFAYWESELDQAAVTALYNNGTPEVTISQSPNHWFTLKDFATGSVDQIGNLNYENTIGTVEFVNNFVSTEAVKSSTLTEQSLVNNNVSVLNGESVDMNSTNLVTSNLTRTQPYSNYSFNFDATISDWITVSSPGSIFAYGENAFTFSGWVSIDAYTDQDGIFARFGDTSNRVVIKLTFASPSYNGIMFQTVKSGVNGYLRWPGILPTTANGEWKHICLTYASGTVKLYLDGADQGAGVLTGIIANPMPDLSSFNAPLDIANDRHSANRFLNGRTSNFCVFDRALTEDEILNIYNNGVTQDLQTTSSFSNNILAWWPMDQRSSYYDGTDWVVRDLEGGKDGNGINTGNVEDMVGNAPGSDANGSGVSLAIENLIGDMKDSKLNAFSINMADYADGVTNPANSGRSTDTP